MEREITTVLPTDKPIIGKCPICGQGVIEIRQWEVGGGLYIHNYINITSKAIRKTFGKNGLTTVDAHRVSEKNLKSFKETGIPLWERK